MRKNSYFSHGSDAMLALEGMIDLAGCSGVLYAMSIILRQKGATLHAMQIESFASQLGIITTGNAVEFTVRLKDGSIVKL